MRVIQDSEDEDDLDIDDVAPAAPKLGDAPLQHDPSSPGAAEHGTGSTESLKWKIEATHRAHLQSPSSPSTGLSGQQSSLLDRGNKNRKTTPSDNPAQKTSFISPDLMRRTTPITYGKSKASANSLTLEERLADSDPRLTVTTAEKNWDLPHSVQQEWHQHEPMGLFPEPSSTVPNATATQQQLLGQIQALTSDGPKYEPAKSSIPWSEYLKSSIRDTEEPSEPVNHTEPPSDNHNSLPSDALGSLPLEPTPPLIQTPKLSQRARRGSSVRLRRSPLRNEVVQDQPKMEVREPVLPADSMLPVEGEQHDTIVVSPHQPKQVEGKNITLQHPRSKKRSSSVASSEDELATYGFPKEQYKPRPSRSRSSNAAVLEPVDYSVRPERAIKRSKRSKTTGGEMTLSTPEKIQRICEMGFTATVAETGLRQNKGDITTTIESLVTADVDELAPSQSATKRGNSNSDGPVDPCLPIGTTHGEISKNGIQDKEPCDKIATKERTSSDINPEQITADTAGLGRIITPVKDPRVKVVIPRSKMANISPIEVHDEIAATTSPEHDLTETASRNTKRRKATLDELEPLLESTDNPSNITKDNRRARGRPRKQIKMTEAGPHKQINEQNEEQEAVVTHSVLQELQQLPNEDPLGAEINADGAQETGPQHEHAEEIAPSPPLPLPSEAASILKAPPRSSEKGPRVVPNINSPIGKGKVPYRVGLSKRARIAPLLRMVKK